MVIAESVNGGLVIIFGEALLAGIEPGLGPDQVVIDLAGWSRPISSAARPYRPGRLVSRLAIPAAPVPVPDASA
jgi:hypothetical protein